LRRPPLSVLIPIAATYGFSAVTDDQAGNVESRRLESKPDPLNRHAERTNTEPDDLTSILVIPNATPLPYRTRRDGIPHGILHDETIASDILGNERPVWVYTPTGFSTDHEPYPFVVIFDGERYNHAPHVLDALIADGEIPPVVAILVDQIEIRNQELPCNPDFARALATELVPWAREKRHLSDDPSMAALNGVSFGGLCSAYTALKHHDVFGNAFMQSGSCWYHPELKLQVTQKSEDTVGVSVSIPTIIGDYMASERVPVRIYQECGNVENGPPPARVSQIFGNRWLHDILTLKGYDTHYVEFNGGHDDAWWRGTFAKGIRWIFGTEGA
jgi:enterochelin esterase family protein